MHKNCRKKKKNVCKNEGDSLICYKNLVKKWKQLECADRKCLIDDCSFCRLVKKSSRSIDIELIDLNGVKSKIQKIAQGVDCEYTGCITSVKPLIFIKIIFLASRSDIKSRYLAIFENCRPHRQPGRCGHMNMKTNLETNVYRLV